ncbi:helix-turn-helix domain-containing protein [Bacteroides acidifaciens]|uniref:helix-turn-helix domain-containing protein n=1 Tax=Bacteroides acidifaciens TaxID=85831 RepID=UPI00242CACAB|nr:helix-turn-helix transcriptional regulator [Bacteroides acidifaciens]
MKYIQRIRDLREDNDLNQTQVATILHVGQTTYSDYEKGKVRIPIEHLITLAKYYDVNLDYIAGISDIKCKFPKK